MQTCGYVHGRFPQFTAAYYIYTSTGRYILEWDTKRRDDTLRERVSKTYQYGTVRSAQSQPWRTCMFSCTYRSRAYSAINIIAAYQIMKLE
jgi:hypothetical protein